MSLARHGRHSPITIVNVATSHEAGTERGEGVKVDWCKKSGVDTPAYIAPPTVVRAAGPMNPKHWIQASQEPTFVSMIAVRCMKALVVDSIPLPVVGRSGRFSESELAKYCRFNRQHSTGTGANKHRIQLYV